MAVVGEEIVGSAGEGAVGPAAEELAAWKFAVGVSAELESAEGEPVEEGIVVMVAGGETAAEPVGLAWVWHLAAEVVVVVAVVVVVGLAVLGLVAG